MQISKMNKMLTYGTVLLGVLIGCSLYLLLAFYQKDYLTNYGLEKYQMTLNLTKHDLLMYVMKRRISQMIIFILFVILTNFYCATSLFCLCFGCYYGFVTCDLFVQYGMSGVGYSFFCFFPHYLFIFIAVYLICKWRENRIKELIKYNKSMKKMECFIKIIVIFMLFGLSFAWEIEFQKNFLNYFFQYLV